MRLPGEKLGLVLILQYYYLMYSEYKECWYFSVTAKINLLAWGGIEIQIAINVIHSLKLLDQHWNQSEKKDFYPAPEYFVERTLLNCRKT